MFNQQYQPYQPYVPQPRFQQQAPDWVYVPTVADVQNVGVQPGNRAWIMVQNECVFAIRSADGMGIMTTDFYRFEKYDPNAKTQTEQYVTRAELEQILMRMKKEANHEPAGE